MLLRLVVTAVTVAAATAHQLADEHSPHVIGANAFSSSWRRWPSFTAENDCVAASNETIKSLLRIYNATGGAGWVNDTGWRDGAISDPCCDGQWFSADSNDTAVKRGWYGLECNSQGDVITIELIANNLMLSIPPELGDLTHLEKLHLARNSLTGTVPWSDLARLKDLGHLILQDNQLTGKISGPDLGVLTNLVQIIFNDNQLTGRIPWPDLTPLTGLVFLFIHNNHMTGNISGPDLAQLTNLGLLMIGSNRLTGQTPWSALAELTSMFFLVLQDNQLTGEISGPDIAKLTQLQMLCLDSNRYSGTIPVQIAGLSLLEQLFLQENDLTGPIDAAFFTMPALQMLLLFDNALTKTIPAQLATNSSTTLTSVLLSLNLLTGPLPPHLFAPLASSGAHRSCSAFLYHIETFAADGNLISGPLNVQADDAALANTNLTQLSLAGNDLSGSVPSRLFRIKTLRVLELSQNKLGGHLPSNDTMEEGVLCESLETLSLAGNHISGTAPTWLTHLDNLTVLQLRSNRLSCDLPEDWTNLFGNATKATAEVTADVLTGNYFSCPIPKGLLHWDLGGSSYVCAGIENWSESMAAAGLAVIIVAAIEHRRRRCASNDSHWHQKFVWWRRHESLALSTEAAQCAVYADFLVSAMKLVAAIFVVIMAAVVPAMVSSTDDDEFECQGAYQSSVALKSGSASPETILTALLSVTFVLVLGTIAWGWVHRNRPLRNEIAERESRLTGPSRRGAKFMSMGLLLLCVVVSMVPQIANVLVQQSAAATALQKYAMAFFAACIKSVFSGVVLPQSSRHINRRGAFGGFETTVTLMTALLLWNGVVVPLLVVLIFDTRCLGEALPWTGGESLDVSVDLKYCNYRNDQDGSSLCPDARYPDEGYKYSTYDYTYNYPVGISDECGGAVILTYTPVVMTALMLQGVLQPIVWILIAQYWTDNEPNNASSSLWKTVAQFCSPELVWPSEKTLPRATTASRLDDRSRRSEYDGNTEEMRCFIFDDDGGGGGGGEAGVQHLPLELHIDLLFSNSVLVIGEMLAFGIVSPMVAVVGFLAMTTTSAVYLHLLGRQIDADWKTRRDTSLWSDRHSFVLPSRGTDTTGAVRAAGLPIACTVWLVVSVSCFVGTVLLTTFPTYEPWRDAFLFSAAVLAAVVVVAVLAYIFTKHRQRIKRRRELSHVVSESLIHSEFGRLNG